MTESLQDYLMERADRLEDLFRQLIAAVEECARQLDHIYYGMPE